jgi:hypothetical protein
MLLRLVGPKLRWYEQVAFMNDTLDRAKARFRRRVAHVKAWFAKVREFFETPRRRGSSTPRICPYCGLITPRFKLSCLECGRRLAPAK